MGIREMESRTPHTYICYTPRILSIFGLNEILLLPYYGFLLYNINYFQGWLASHSTPQATDIKPFPQEEPIERSLSLKPFLFFFLN